MKIKYFFYIIFYNISEKTRYFNINFKNTNDKTKKLKEKMIKFLLEG